MNSLYRLSVFGPNPPTPPTKSRSESECNLASPVIEPGEGTSAVVNEKDDETDTASDKETDPNGKEQEHFQESDGVYLSEKTALLSPSTRKDTGVRSSALRTPIKCVVDALVGTVTVVVSTLRAPITYIIACFYDEEGRFSAILPVRRIARTFTQDKTRSTAQAVGISAAPTSVKHAPVAKRAQSSGSRREAGTLGSENPSPSDSQPDLDFHHEFALAAEPDDVSPSRHTRSKSLLSRFLQPNGSGNISIRIQEIPRAQRPRQNAANPDSSLIDTIPELTAENVKSPLGSGSLAPRLDKYPRAVPTPPRPLVPQRQPSYTAPKPSLAKPQKYLVIDLDETLIHSNSNGGKMTSGYNLEVRFSNTVGVSNHPILYTVRKRPHCDEFLKKVSKWYNCVIFTAGLQDYADPVIDFLERERKYFVGRYYRQHCTFRNGAYIKDIAQVEADLSKVMILDNSPMSYIFQPDNAIPIEGWIGDDPHDSNLLHLIPLLEGLQHVEDVRAICGLRSGEVVSHEPVAQNAKSTQEPRASEAPP